MRIQSPKKRILLKKSKTVIQNWKNRSAYVKAEVVRKKTGKNGRCESIKLSPPANLNENPSISGKRAKNRTLKNLSSAERVFHAESMFRDVSPKFSTDCPLTPKKDRFNTYLVSPPFPFGDTNLIQFVQFFGSLFSAKSKAIVESNDSFSEFSISTRAFLSTYVYKLKYCMIIHNVSPTILAKFNANSSTDKEIFLIFHQRFYRSSPKFGDFRDF